MLCRALRERGHDVLPVSFKRQYPRWLFPGQSDRDPSEKPLEVGDARYWIDSLNPVTWLTAFWRIRRYRPDVLIIPWWTTFWAAAWSVLGALNRLFLRSPLVFICHNVLPHEARWWDPPLAKIVLRWGTCFVAQSAEEERRLAALIPGARIAVIPHPVYDMFASERIPKEEACRRLGLPPDVPILLFFGIVREYKGLQDVLAALPVIQARLGRVILVVAGEFWEDKGPYLEAIQRLGIDDSVVIEDRYIPNEDVPVYFSAADALMALYRRVTGSGAVRMAQGFGLPVVTTLPLRALGVAEGGRGVTSVAQHDAQALAEALARCLTEAPGQMTAAQSGESEGVGSWMRLVDLLEGLGGEVRGSAG